ncbi:hypothetical protein WJX72_000571 [[Myrmecia] bisecta]|uniref:Myb-like domain-containing protein n=1 Tax=[Myrmecia] bisecta TaxID=41462 RepID=A0AAW1QQ13_9CHLO
MVWGADKLALGLGDELLLLDRSAPESPGRKRNRWTVAETKTLHEAVACVGKGNWERMQVLYSALRRFTGVKLKVSAEAKVLQEQMAEA